MPEILQRFHLASKFLKSSINIVFHPYYLRIMCKSTKTVQFIEIQSETTGQRIDNFLFTRLKGAPKTLIYRLLRKGEIRVNKGRKKPTYKLQVGDVIRIPPLRLSDAKNIPARNIRLEEILVNSIIYEDGDFLIVNKPSGVAVHGGSGISLGVIETMRTLYPRAKRLELVHRLDRDTSGCLILAKKTSILRGFHQLIRDSRVEKRYVALLKDRMPTDKRRVNAPLLKNTVVSGERLVRVSEDGKPSTTVFHLSQRYDDCSYVEIELLTGRTHQIRVHAAHINQSIAGDPKYGDQKFNQQLKRLGLNRLFLHASSLRFQHPGSDEPLLIEAPLPSELTKVLNRMRSENESS